MLKKTVSALCAIVSTALFAESPLPVSKWEVKSDGTAKMQIQEQNGVLKLSFDIDPVISARSGHIVYKYGYADLLLKKPFKLTFDTERIIFERQLDIAKSLDKVILRPIIRDQEGECFLYSAVQFPHLNSGRTSWSKFMTPDFFAGEAGAPTQDIFELIGTPKNFKPDGKLEFLGFRVFVRRTEAGKGPVKGCVTLGEYEFKGQKIGYFHPYMYADSVLTAKGTYQFAYCIKNNFQGLPVAEGIRKIVFDPADPASCKQKIEFVLGPDDNYWIEYQITDARGAVVKSGSMRQQALNNPDRTPVHYADTKKAPAIGYVRVNPDHGTRGVYQKGESPKIEFRMFPKDKKSFSVNWKLLDSRYNEEFDKGTLPVTFKNNSPVSLTVIPKCPADRSALRLAVTVLDGKKVIDSQEYFFGFKTDPSERHDYPGAIVNRHLIKKHPYNRTTYAESHSKNMTNDKYIEHFKTYLNNSKQLATSITYMLDLKLFEVMPGVFDFALLDRIMDAAADEGFKITVRLAHADANGTDLYRWLKYSRQYSYDGSIAPGHRWYGAYAVNDPGTVKLWLDAYRALYNRYQKHTAFEGYYIMQPGGEWCVVDQPWNGTMTGYEPSTEQAFRSWLKSQYTLAEINCRWGKNYKTFNEIHAVMPDFRGGENPDLRLEWLDFQRFKRTLEGRWMQTAVNFIRSFDDNRVTISYTKPDELARLLGGKLDYGHNGGNHFGNNLGDFIDAWEKYKVGWITEPIFPHNWAEYGDPAGKGWVLDWSVWVMTAQAAGGGSNLHIYYYPQEKKTEDMLNYYGGIKGFDIMERYRPVLAELHDMKLYAPKKEAVVIKDDYTLFTKHRTTFTARLDDLRRWHELLVADSVPYANFAKDHQSEYKLLVPNILDEVISKETLDILNTCVRNGAKMMITANTGKYVPELGKEPFQLLKSLGITPPASEYNRKGMDISAVVNDANPVFDKGKKIVFITGDSLHRQLNSEFVRKQFWKYPYRWIPETNYFGWYPKVKTNGRILAKFADGGAALTLHKVGKGEVIVFWGTPDIGNDNCKGMMARAADWAGIVNPLKGNPIQYYLEGYNKRLNRHYVLVYNEKPGSFKIAVPNMPDGKWFIDDPVSCQRIGLFDGKYIRENGLELTWEEGYSPLKYIRMIPGNGPKWFKSYKIVPNKEKK